MTDMKASARVAPKALLACLVLVGAVTGLTQDAFAQKRRVPAADLPASADLGDRIPLTVNRRSWLDSGNAVSTTGNYGPSYVAANTAFSKSQDQIFAPDRFGNAEFPSHPYVPGRSQPVVEGSTLPNGQVVVDNVLLPQNYYFNPTPDLPFGR